MFKVQCGPWVYRMEKSEPFQAGNMRLFPIVRIWAWRRRRARVGAREFTAQGALLESISPLAMVLERPGERRLIPIIDITRLLLWAIAGLCLAGFLSALAARRAIRAWNRSTGGET